MFSDHSRILCVNNTFGGVFYFEKKFLICRCISMLAAVFLSHLSTNLSLSVSILLGNVCLGERRATFSTLLGFIAVCEENGKIQGYCIIRNYCCPSSWHTFPSIFLLGVFWVTILPLLSGYPHRCNESHL